MMTDTPVGPEVKKPDFLGIIRQRLAPGSTYFQSNGNKKSQSWMNLGVPIVNATTHTFGLLVRTVFFHESSSAIIIGKQGSGKTMLFENMFGRASKLMEMGNMSRSEQEQLSFKVVRLNGLFCTSLRQAIQEIQSYFSDDVEFNGYMRKVGGTAEDEPIKMFDFMWYSLGKSKYKSIVIVLDNIEYFCSHPSQALLYNLFNMTRSKIGGLCVIGMTRSCEILELFEKRVKSRFSHRIIQVPSPPLEAFRKIAHTYLILECPEWNKNVDMLISSNGWKRVLTELHERSGTIGSLVKFLYYFIVRVEVLTEKNFEDSWTEYNVSGRSLLTMELTRNQVILVVAIYKIVKGGSQTFRFRQVSDLVGKFLCSRQIASWRDLILLMKSLEEKELITPLESGRNYSQILYRSELTYQELHQIFKKYPRLPTEILSIL